jgi:hypothetical protein
MSYILEVQRYKPRWPIRKGECLFEHVGYMDKYFNTKDEAAIYYDIHNPHMPSMFDRNTVISEHDPNTKLRYVICNWYWEFFCVVPWYQPFIRIRPFPDHLVYPSQGLEFRII